MPRTSSAVGVSGSRRSGRPGENPPSPAGDPGCRRFWAGDHAPRAWSEGPAQWQWIAAEDPGVAQGWAQRVVEETNRLPQFPESGAPRRELGKGVRSVVVGRYLVLYRIGPDSVDIVRVVHGARDLAGLMGEDSGEE
jgi:toxin ParE1/3/4